VANKRLRKLKQSGIITWAGPQETVYNYIDDGNTEIQQRCHVRHPSLPSDLGVLLRRQQKLGTIKLIVYTLPGDEFTTRYEASACRADDVEEFNPNPMLKAMRDHIKNNPPDEED